MLPTNQLSQTPQKWELRELDAKYIYIYIYYQKRKIKYHVYRCEQALSKVYKSQRKEINKSTKDIEGIPPSACIQSNKDHRICSMMTKVGHPTP